MMHACLYLFPEDRLRLTTKTLLFAVVTSSALRGMPFLTLLVLCHFVSLVYFALFAKGTTLFRYIDL